MDWPQSWVNKYCVKFSILKNVVIKTMNTQFLFTDYVFTICVYWRLPKRYPNRYRRTKNMLFLLLLLSCWIQHKTLTEKVLQLKNLRWPDTLQRPIQNVSIYSNTKWATETSRKPKSNETMIYLNVIQSLKGKINISSVDTIPGKEEVDQFAKNGMGAHHPNHTQTSIR